MPQLPKLQRLFRRAILTVRKLHKEDAIKVSADFIFSSQIIVCEWIKNNRRSKWHPRKTSQLFTELKGALDLASNNFSHPAAVMLSPGMLSRKKTLARALQSFLRDGHPELSSIQITDDGILKIGSN